MYKNFSEILYLTEAEYRAVSAFLAHQPSVKEEEENTCKVDFLIDAPGNKKSRTLSPSGKAGGNIWSPGWIPARYTVEQRSVFFPPQLLSSYAFQKH